MRRAGSPRRTGARGRAGRAGVLRKLERLRAEFTG
jgi:hypothetical protein